MMSDAAIRALLLTTRRIAVVGASDKPDRAGHYIPAFLLERGYEVALVNPLLAGQRLHGRTVLANLEEASLEAASLEAASLETASREGTSLEGTSRLDLVDVFRRSDQAGAVVDEAIRLGAKAVWLQLGVVDDAAGERARAAGLAFVQDRCPAIEWRRLGLPPRII